MNIAWVQELFGAKKPVIAMAHLPALPGTPRYDKSAGISRLVEEVQKDVGVLLDAGVDAVMFCNEDDRPYVFEAGLEQVTAMTRVISQSAPTSIPFGVDFLWDPVASMAIAYACGATFVRGVLTGVYESDMGLWTSSAGRVMRFRNQIGADSIRVFYNMVPEFASSLGVRSVAERAQSVVTSCMADAILVSGPMAGTEPDISHFFAIKEATREVPVFVNTGATIENIGSFLQVADGVIVGSSLKVDGKTWNPVDPNRARAFVSQVQHLRDTGEVVDEGFHT